MRSIALLLLLPTAALAAPLRSEPPVWLVFEGLYARPDVTGDRIASGGGVRIGYRFTDQLSTAAGFETLYVRTGVVTGVSAGFEAMLDATPIAPFLELSVLRTDPIDRAGFSLAQRSGFGADWRLSRSVALGAVVRYLSPLDPEPNAPGLARIHFGLRLMLIPGAF